jgi:hypothetical protein
VSQALPHRPNRAAPGACLVRVRRRSTGRPQKKARAFRLQCPSRESGGRRTGGPTAGEQHGEQLPCAGSPAVESIPILVSTFPFAGGRASGGLGRLGGNEGNLQPFVKTLESMTMGCSSSVGGGEPRATSSCGVRTRGGGEVLRSGRLGPLGSSLSFQSVIGATFGGVVASPASGVTKSGSLRRSTFRRACSAGKANVDGVNVVRCPLTSKGVSCRTPCSSKGAAREARANAEGARFQKGRAFKAREDRALGEVCPRVVVLLQKSIGGVGLKEAYAPHFTRFEERTGIGV